MKFFFIIYFINLLLLENFATMTDLDTTETKITDDLTSIFAKITTNTKKPLDAIIELSAKAERLSEIDDAVALKAVEAVKFSNLMTNIYIKTTTYVADDADMVAAATAARFSIIKAQVSVIKAADAKTAATTAKAEVLVAHGLIIQTIAKMTSAAAVELAAKAERLSAIADAAALKANKADWFSNMTTIEYLKTTTNPINFALMVTAASSASSAIVVADDDTVAFHESDPTQKAHIDMVAADDAAQVAMMNAADANAAATVAKAEAMAAAKIAARAEAMAANANTQVTDATPVTSEVTTEVVVTTV